MTLVRRASLILLLTLAVLLSTFDLLSLESSIEKYELENGATLILLPIEGVPIVSSITLNDVGGIKESPGITGISHYLEHMAFKGTEKVGSKDIEAEKAALQKCHDIFDLILEERKKGEHSDEGKLKELQDELKKAVEYANEYAIANEFNQIIELNGGKGLNAGTSQDMTLYSVNLPSNKLELWMLMEADRFTNPVYREFYQERDVILEERRMIYSNPIRKFMDELIEFTYQEHPYRYPVIGYEEDIENLTVKDVENYFEKHYGANNLVFSIVGDIDTKKTLAMANKYLAKIPSGTKSEKVQISEPEQQEERIFLSESAAQPIMLIGYHIPAANHPDYPVYTALADILGQGRSSRLYKALVEDKKLAVSAFAYSGMPGRSYPNLFMIGVIPAQGVELDDCLREVDDQLKVILTESVNTTELEGVKKRALKSSYSRLMSRGGLAYQLAYYESMYGDYSLMFDELKNTEAITKNDIDRVLRKTFRDTNRIIGRLETRSE